MSILSNILHKIFPQPKSSTNIAPASVPPLASEAGAANTTAATTAGASQPGSVATSASPFPPFTNQPSPATVGVVDVEKVLNELAHTSGQTLNWQTSIVDLLKLLNLDSSLQARKELAAELNYAGSTEDSAAMNVWLHRQVMNKLAANGGKVPAELRD